MPQNERLPYPTSRFTKYFWTVNLNRAAYNKRQAKELMMLLYHAVFSVFVQGNVVAFSHPNHKFNRNFVDDNLLQIAVEIGNNKGRIHAHIIQDIKHRSIINIAPEDVKAQVEAKIQELTNGHGLNVYVNRMVKDSERVLEEYLRKESKEWREDSAAVKGMWTWKLAARPGGSWQRVVKQRTTKALRPEDQDFDIERYISELF